MALTKKFTYVGTASGDTIYALIQRDRDNAYLDSDMKFRETPTTPAQALSELTLGGVGTQRYQFSDATEAWETGYYHITIYKQAGAGAAFNTDTVLAVFTLYVLGDEIKEQPFSED